MRYAQLGTSGLVVSRLAFGAGSLGVGETLPGLIKNIDQATADTVVGKAIDAGINFFDTSNKYVDGDSELTLGRALKTSRSDVIVATKCGLPIGPAPLDRGLSARHVIRECEASLKRLGTDWIDVYYAHTTDAATPIEETARAFEYLVTSGKVRYVAVSNWPAWQAARLQGVQASAGYAPIVANQVYYSLLGRQMERELVPLAAASGLGLVVYSALAGGFLSGKYLRDQPAPAGTRRATFNIAPRFAMDHGFDVIDVLKRLGQAYGVPPAHIALAWTMQQPGVSSVLFGISRLAQLEENLPAADLLLEAAHVAELNALTALGD
jgi:aryl-alcohol dehydrogenase-like predicted oxidoreductase